MAPNIIRQNKKKTKVTFWCDSCMLSGNGTLERHDDAVHRPNPSMYFMKRAVKKTFRPKASKLKMMGFRNRSNKTVSAPEEPEVAKFILNDDEEEQEFNRRRVVYPINHPNFNGPDSILTCLKCFKIFMILDNLKSHHCP